MNKHLSLFTTFFKIGLFTFGGGYAMISLIEKEAVEKKKWITSEDILDIVAIAESTPGPIAINSATFVGYNVGGVLGSFAATLGTVLPSFIIIMIISTVLNQFAEVRAVQYAFFGIRAGVLALLVKSLISMYKKCNKGLIPYILMALSFIAVAFFDLGVIYVIIFCGIVGFVSSVIAKKYGKAKEGGTK